MNNWNLPKYLDLLHIKQPIPAIMSILHRATGAALFFGLPFLLWLLASSLDDADAFATYKAVFDQPLIKIILLLFLWATLHHIFAGIRFLFIDIHKGVDLKTARLTAALTLFGAAICALILGGFLLW